MFVWISDFRETSGEGRLARLYVDKCLKKQNNYLKIISPENNYLYLNGSLKKRVRKKKIDYNSFVHKYLYPILGCFFSWYCFLYKKKFLYLNYLPLWNIFLFIFFAPKTKLGPITGSKIYGKSLVRKLFVPFFYRFSAEVINLRYSNINFATDNLRKYLKKYKGQINYNFVFNYLKKNKHRITKKKYDVIIYFRKHKNKNMNFFLNLAEILINKKISVVCFGDKINVKGVKNLGNVSHKKSLKFIINSKIGINSAENFYTFFMMDCLNNGVNVLCEKKTASKKKISLNDKVILSDFNFLYLTTNKILEFLKKN